MGIAVTTVASGGLPVKELAGGGIAVTEVAKFGIAVTKVTGAGAGMGVTFVSATGGPVFTAATLDGTPTNATLSNGNKTATHTTTTGGSGARSTAIKSSGKYYFEGTFGQTTGYGVVDCIGVILSTGTYADVSSGNNCATYSSNAGYVRSNNTQFVFAPYTAGQIARVAIDLDNRKCWFAVNAGQWLGDVIANQNPATNTGGRVVAAGAFAPVIGFGGTGALVGDNATLNLGASAFVYAVPSGFTAGWPA